MTHRDNLALCAMQVLLKKECNEHINFWNAVKRFFGFKYCVTTTLDPNKIAKRAYIIADAMLDADQNC